jgi:flagellar biosynthesis component FlhA
MLLVHLSFSFGDCVACPSVPFLLVIVLLVLLSFFFGHFVAFPSVPVFFAIVLLFFLSKEKFRRTSNTITKRKRQKDKQHHGQKKRAEGQATQ